MKFGDLEMNESQDANESHSAKHPRSEALVSGVESSESQQIEANALKKSRRLQDKELAKIQGKASIPAAS